MDGHPREGFVEDVYAHRESGIALLAEFRPSTDYTQNQLANANGLIALAGLGGAGLALAGPQIAAGAALLGEAGGTASTYGYVMCTTGGVCTNALTGLAVLGVGTTAYDLVNGDPSTMGIAASGPYGTLMVVEEIAGIAGMFRNAGRSVVLTTSRAPNNADDLVPDSVIRRDNDFSATTNENGAPKPYLDENGNMIPANPDGSISTTSQVRGGNSTNSNVTSTTDPASATNPQSYGNQEIEIDTGRLQADIDAGLVDGVSIKTPQQVQNDLQGAIDNAQVRFDNNPSRNNADRLDRANQDLSNAARDGECLISGCIPSDYISAPRPVSD
jgi:hypothetical protein